MQLHCRHMDIYTALIIAHVIGTALGAGGATLAEVQINKALKDGKVDASERALMHANYTTIRVGMVLILFSGLALVWWHLGQGNNWVLTSPKIWTKDIMFLVIIANAFFLTKRWVPLWLGSAISFTSWWGAAVLGIWRTHGISFPEFLIAYVAAIFIMAGILEAIRRYVTARRR